MLKLSAIIYCSVVSAALATALFAPVMADAQTSSPTTLRVAIVPDYPPLEFKDPATGKITGFDYDLGEAMAKRMGAKIDWQETSFDQMVSALQTNRIDMILSAMVDLPGRRDHVMFVDYMKTGPQFYVQKARADEFSTMLALCGKRVGVNRRSGWLAEVQSWSEANCAKANKAAITVIGTDGSADARLQLRQNRVDAAVQGGETLTYVNGIDNNAYQALGPPFVWHYNGIGIAPGNATLIKTVSNALTEMIADGSYAALLKKWGIENFATQKVAINSQDK